MMMNGCCSLLDEYIVCTFHMEFWFRFGSFRNVFIFGEYCCNSIYTEWWQPFRSCKRIKQLSMPQRTAHYTVISADAIGTIVYLTRIQWKIWIIAHYCLCVCWWFPHVVSTSMHLSTSLHKPYGTIQYNCHHDITSKYNNMDTNIVVCQ